jgi:hypothetical protein
MKRSASAVCAATILFAIPAHASEPDASPAQKNPLERRVILPDLVGIRIGSPLGSTSSLSLTPGLGGLVSYSYNDVSAFGGQARVESVSVGPSADVRGGRFTIGGSVRFTHVSSRLEAQSQATDGTSFSLQVVPRVGILVPLGSHVTLWPRVGVGFLVGSSEQQGAFVSSQQSTLAGLVAQTDALVVVDLGSRFFVAAGPELRFGWTTSRLAGFEQNQASLQAGASVAMGVAF